MPSFPSLFIGGRHVGKGNICRPTFTAWSASRKMGARASKISATSRRRSQARVKCRRVSTPAAGADYCRWPPQHFGRAFAPTVNDISMRSATFRDSLSAQELASSRTWASADGFSTLDNGRHRHYRRRLAGSPTSWPQSNITIIGSITLAFALR